MCRFSFEVAAQLLGIAELFVLEHALCANVAKGARQLIVMRITARQTIVVDKDPEFALAQRRTVEMRQVVHCRAGRMHGRLVDQMYLAKQARIAGNRARQGRQPCEKRHPRRSMLFEHGGHRVREVLNRTEARRDVIRSPVCSFTLSYHRYVLLRRGSAVAQPHTRLTMSEAMTGS